MNEIIAAADTAFTAWFDGGSFDFHDLQCVLDAINNNNSGGVLFGLVLLPAPPLRYSSSDSPALSQQANPSSGGAPTIRGPPPLSSQSLARDQRVTTTVWLWSAYGRAEAGTFASLGPTRRRMSENVVFELSTSTLSHPGACASLEAIFVRPPSWRLASDPALKGRIVFETWWRRGRIELPVQKKYVRDLLQA